MWIEVVKTIGEQEIKKKAIQESLKKINCFEKAVFKTDVRPTTIKTINEKMEGHKFPGTEVEFRKKVFQLEGKIVEGVFPKFNSLFDVRLPKELWKASDTEQFKACVKQLQQRVARDPEFANNFTSRQLEQIKAGAPRISGLTWHHSEIPGKMQLVNSDIHSKVKHTGGRFLWGGGSESR